MVLEFFGVYTECTLTALCLFLGLWPRYLYVGTALVHGYRLR